MGTDDSTEIPPTKFLLAIQSPVFERMFFGDFGERHQDKVRLDYPSAVLKVLVHYCYSNEIVLPDLIYTKDDPTQFSDEEAVLMVQLRAAANYFELIDLYKKTSEELGKLILNHDNVFLPLRCL